MIRTTKEKPKSEHGPARLGTARQVATRQADNGDANPDAAKKVLAIPPPKFEVAEFLIRGTSAYCQNKFSAKARAQIREKQEAGSTATKGKKRDAKDFKANYEAAMHRDAKGRYGIPAPAFRNAMIDACRLVNFKMTHAKQAVFALADFNDADDGTPLVAITKGEPRYCESTVRNDSGVCDLRARPLWEPGWEAVVRIKYDADLFTMADVANLLMRAGVQVGVGEGRPNSKDSNGIGWGTFELVDES